jgi:WD40 repeat protein
LHHAVTGVQTCALPIYKSNSNFWISGSYKLSAVSAPGTTTADICDTAGKKINAINLINQEVGGLFFSYGDKILATIPLMHPNYLTLWDISGKELRSMAGQGADYAYYFGLFSKNNRSVLLINYNNLATLWDTSGNKISQFWHPAYINNADISTDGNFIITGCEDGSARLWNSNGKLIDMFRSPEKETSISVKFSPSGSFFIMTDGKNLRLFDLKGNLIQAIPYDWSAPGVFFYDNEKELLLGNSEGIKKVTLKEPIDTFLNSLNLYDLSIKEKLSYNIISYNDGFESLEPDELYDAGDYFLTSALQLSDPDKRQKFFNNAEKLLIKGSSIDSLPARFYLKLTDLYFKNSLYTDEKNSDEINDMFKKIYKSNNYSELMDAALYYYNNINSMTFSYNFHENAILITDKLIRLYPSIGKYIIRDRVGFPFSLLKWQENKAALNLCILAKKCYPDNVMVNTYLPLCYLMNDSTDRAKELYQEWKNKDLPPGMWSKREPKYGYWNRSDLRILTNVGIKIKYLDEINELLNDTLK